MRTSPRCPALQFNKIRLSGNRIVYAQASQSLLQADPMPVFKAWGEKFPGIPNVDQYGKDCVSYACSLDGRSARRLVSVHLTGADYSSARECLR